MADGGAGRCLYDLSDDLLRHILFLAPDRDGAATAVLSRRWRWLWRMSGAVYLDSGSFNGGCSSPDQEREAFLRGAEEALPLWLPPPPTAPSGGSRSSLRKAARQTCLSPARRGDRGQISEHAMYAQLGLSAVRGSPGAAHLQLL
jgi:hypothetical protein